MQYLITIGHCVQPLAIGQCLEPLAGDILWAWRHDARTSRDWRDEQQKQHQHGILLMDFHEGPQGLNK